MLQQLVQRAGVRHLRVAIACRPMSHTSFGLDKYETSDVQHSPIFTQPILDHLLPVIAANAASGVATRCLDMTFGTGGHTSLVLDHGLHLTRSLTVVAADRDRASFSAAQEMSTRYRDGNLVPLQSRFSQLPSRLVSAHLNQWFDAVILETGISNLQWNDHDRGFSHRRKGILDLRMDEPTEARKVPTASEVLQHIDEEGLVRLLRVYGGLQSKAKYVAEAIIEARYMFHRFKTTQELYEVIGTAASNFKNRSLAAISSPDNCGIDASVLQREMMEKTMLALRFFVNNELNELDFGLRGVARPLLKREVGLVFVIVHSEVEKKLVTKCLSEVDIHLNDMDKVGSSLEAVNAVRERHWEVLSGSPFNLSAAEKTLHPRFQSASLFIAKRTFKE